LREEILTRLLVGMQPRTILQGFFWQMIKQSLRTLHPKRS
jgi:hypothetical protein